MGWLDQDRKPLKCDWSRLKREKPVAVDDEASRAVTIDCVVATTADMEQDRETTLVLGDSLQLHLAVRAGEEEALMPEESCWLDGGCARHHDFANGQ